MANKFVIKNGYVSKGNSEITGSLIVTQGITGSLFGTASWAQNAVTASHVTGLSTNLYYAEPAVSPIIASPVLLMEQTGSIAIGDGAETSGSNAISIGYAAGSESLWLPFGQFGVINAINIGQYSGWRMGDSLAPISIGSNAGYTSSYFDYGIALGASAAAFSYDSYNTVFIGRAAGYAISASFSSIAVGYGAGYLTATSPYGIFIGQDAGRNAVGLTTNISIGRDAGRLADNANNTVFVGYRAGYQSDSSSFAVSVGDQAHNASVNVGNAVAVGRNAGAGSSNSTGSVAIGPFALSSTANAEYSVAIGNGALQLSAGAKYNVALGYQTAFNTDNATFSTYIGNRAGYNTANLGNSNIIIGSNVTLPSGSTSTMTLGNVLYATGLVTGSEIFPATSIPQTTGQVGIGVIPSSGSLHVNGNVWANSFTGSLFGTASWAQNAVTASHVTGTVTSASYAPNIANTNLTFTGTRTHDLNGNDLTIGEGSSQTFSMFNGFATQMTYSSSIWEIGSNYQNFSVNNTQSLDLLQNEVVINQTGQDLDFRVEGDTDTNLLKVDAGTDKVAVGTTTTSGKFGVFTATQPYGIYSNVTSNALSTYGVYAAATGAPTASNTGIYSTANGSTSGRNIGAQLLASNSSNSNFAVSAGTWGSLTPGGNNDITYLGFASNNAATSASATYVSYLANAQTNSAEKYGSYINLYGNQATGNGYGLRIVNSSEFTSGTATGISIDNGGSSAIKYGMRVSNTGGGGTGTNYGIYVYATGSAAATNYGVYVDAGKSVFNAVAGDHDFQVKGDTDSNLLYADASTDSIGVGTATPGYKLDTVGDINTSTGYRVAGNAGLTGTYTFGGGTTGDIATMTFTGGILTAVTTVP